MPRDSAPPAEPPHDYAALLWTGPQIAATFRREDPRARTASVSWAGSGLVPAWLDQVRELSEYWIHRQQLRQGLGRPSDLRADLAGPVPDGLRWAYPYRLAQAPSRPGDTVTRRTTCQLAGGPNSRHPVTARSPASCSAPGRSSARPSWHEGAGA
ncbi:MAG: hypothetical protein ACRDN1_25200, partial [Trebonia sp.]